MKILVTGGAGFIGSHVVDLALSRGHQVAILDDLSSGRMENVPEGATFFHCDIRDKDATTRVFESFRPDAVSHQAAQASVSISMRDPVLDANINIIGGLHVADAARSVGVKTLVFASTGGAIYGNIAQGAAAEDHPRLPISPYAIDKLAFEMLLSVYQAQGALVPRILRYANVYGPRQDPHGEAGVVAIFLGRALAGAPLQVNALRSVGDDGCLRDYVFVSDIAQANLFALEGKMEIPVMNLGTSIPTSTRTLARTILELCPESRSTLVDGAPREGDIDRSVLDGSKYSQLIGPYVPLAEGMAATASWYKAHRS